VPRIFFHAVSESLLFVSLAMAPSHSLHDRSELFDIIVCQLLTSGTFALCTFSRVVARSRCRFSCLTRLWPLSQGGTRFPVPALAPLKTINRIERLDTHPRRRKTPDHQFFVSYGPANRSGCECADPALAFGKTSIKVISPADQLFSRCPQVTPRFFAFPPRHSYPVGDFAPLRR